MSAPENGYFRRPTSFSEVSPTATIAQEEILAAVIRKISMKRSQLLTIQTAL